MVDNTPTTTGGPVAGWSVISQTEGSQISVDGQVERGVTVRFQTTGGTIGSVFVPNYAYTPDMVRQAIQDRANAIDAVANLTQD